MPEEEGIDRFIEVVEDGWGEPVTGTRRRHLGEVLAVIRERAGEDVTREVAEWAGGKHPDLPIEQVRQHAAAEYGIGRDRFGFR